MAGNFVEISAEVQIEIEKNNLSSETVSSPFNQLFVLLGLLIVSTYKYNSNKKEIL
jgi:hypothetical protein